MPSPYRAVKMQSQYLTFEGVERKKAMVAVGKAEGTADCTAEEAAAWFFDYCSRERTSLDRESGNPARLELLFLDEEMRSNEKVFANIKAMPFPLNKREFVVKNIWKRNEDGTITVASCPYDVKNVDYGTGIGKLVRGETKCLFTR